jgi:hypothetical protein
LGFGVGQHSLGGRFRVEQPFRFGDRRGVFGEVGPQAVENLIGGAGRQLTMPRPEQGVLAGSCKLGPIGGDLCCGRRGGQ